MIGVAIICFIGGVIIASLFWYHYVVKNDRKRFNGILRSINNIVNGAEEDYLVKDIKRILESNLKRK